MVGCPPVSPGAHEPPPEMPGYADLVARYNQNLVRVDRLWARAVVELHWRDEDGKHFEQGDGNLIIVPSDKVALSIGKLGQPLLWAGCNGQRYWLFDLHEQRISYVGLHDRVAKPRAQPSPLPFQPLDLIQLTGITPIGEAPDGPSPAVNWDDGHYMIEPPGQHRRVWIDPATARPVRIDLLDADGYSRIVCRLSRWEPMFITGIAPGGFPWLATRLEVALVDREGTMTLYLSDLTDGQDEGRIREEAFDLNYLIKVFKPEKHVDLDADDEYGF